MNAQRKRADHLYCVQMGSGGPIKIGRTLHVDERVKELQTGSPLDLNILRVVERAGHAESALHARLWAHRLRGEWFFPDPEVLEVIRDIESFIAREERHPSRLQLAGCRNCGVRRVRIQADGLCSACEEFKDARTEDDPFAADAA